MSDTSSRRMHVPKDRIPPSFSVPSTQDYCLNPVSREGRGDRVMPSPWHLRAFNREITHSSSAIRSCTWSCSSFHSFQSQCGYSTCRRGRLLSQRSEALFSELYHKSPVILGWLCTHAHTHTHSRMHTAQLNEQIQFNITFVRGTVAATAEQQRDSNSSKCSRCCCCCCCYDGSGSTWAVAAWESRTVESATLYISAVTTADGLIFRAWVC
jgi:hypothetical protein